MQFKYKVLAEEFKLLHPKVKDLIDILDLKFQHEGWPEVRITEILRTPEDQENYYWRQVMEDLKCVESIARATARNKPSWHLWFCAVDFSSKIYTADQKKFILKYLKDGRPASEGWEIFLHDVGAGPHFHVAYEDKSWKQKWSNSLKG